MIENDHFVWAVPADLEPSELLRRASHATRDMQRLIDDNNGNPVWTAECHIEEYDTFFDTVSSSKKDAKKTAAYKMLQFILNEENN